VRGRALWAMQKGQEARELLERACRLLPGEVDGRLLLSAISGESTPLVQALRISSVRAYDHALDLGIARSLRAIDASAEVPAGSLARAVALLMAGRVGEAREAFGAIPRERETADLIRLRGRAALEAGDPAAALRDWESLRRLGLPFPRKSDWMDEARRAAADPGDF
jgi:hypothetical protein